MQACNQWHVHLLTVTASCSYSQVPDGGEQFTVRLSSSTTGAGLGARVEALVNLQQRTIANFTVATTSIINVVSSTGVLPVTVDRTAGTQIMALISYNTSQPRQPVQIGRLPPFQPAQPHIHFPPIQAPLTFNRGVESSTVEIPILSLGSTPVAFLVQINSTIQ